eukprot:CAMPEP_0185277694 /NCGR_PEP_ID=MMETSP1359-20130426/59202_1 /TAXON_ID=552665 /ORGANISM="Bigelowiella longifila, Strain CCMP242" /LENGTH=186 /DNA_ID=CAMNT_0027871897 /DNA_START=21 /DNA_END=581 /DNA_ORIENTATION=+
MKAKAEYQDVPQLELRLLKSEEDKERLWTSECDILSPCAYGAVLNEESIPKINSKIVCGAANNQLQDPHAHGELLLDRKIVYVPDFVANRMGIVNCANESYGRVGSLDEVKDPAILRHLDPEWESGVYRTVRRVLDLSKAEGIASNKAADRLADECLSQPHPIWARRSQEIIDSLVRDRWHEMTSA